MPTEQYTQTELRVSSKRARERLSAQQRSEFSISIAERALRLPAYQRATRIGVYLPLPTEVNTWPLIERVWCTGKRIFAPLVRKSADLAFCDLTPESRFVRNRFAVLEPEGGTQIDPRKLDIVFTPLLVFSERRQRIGFGGGYYDRTFAFAKLRQSFSKPKLIGLAFDCQRAAHIEENAWDIPLFQIVTETKVY